MRGEQLFQQMIRGVAGHAYLPQHASEDVDKQRVADRGSVLSRRTAGERDAEVEFGRGHEGRFYSERRSNNTRARAQSAAI